MLRARSFCFIANFGQVKWRPSTLQAGMHRMSAGRQASFTDGRMASIFDKVGRMTDGRTRGRTRRMSCGREMNLSMYVVHKDLHTS